MGPVRRRPNAVFSQSSQAGALLVPDLPRAHVAREPRGRERPLRGLNALRRGARVSELLFLYECTVHEVVQLRSVAEALGLTVQAASHTYRGLARRGLVEAKGGRYRPTVAGVDALHAGLVDLEADLAERLERLHIIARTRALARTPIAAGATVSLELEDGWLTASAGSHGGSRGVARAAARPGQLVEVERLRGIVPLRPASVELLTVREVDLAEPALARSLGALLADRPHALVAAVGLEAFRLTSAASPRRVVHRFGVAAVVDEAARLGVPSAVVVLDRDAPRLMTQLDASGAPHLELLPIRVRAPRPRDRRAA